MARFFASLIVTVVIMTMVVIAWTPVAKSGGPPPTQFLDCLDYCEDQAICQCAKILGGANRLTKCNIGAQCVNNCECECEVDPICKLWEIDVVGQSFPFVFPFNAAQDCASC